MISFIIPTHNYGEYLADCLKSIINQTKKVDEIIVVDDASTDNTAKVAKSFKEVKYFRVNFNQADKSRNFGFRKSRGDFIMFFDGDDYLRKDAVEILYTALKNNKRAAFAYTDRKDIIIKDEKLIGWKRFKAASWNYKKLQDDNFVASWALIRRKYFVPFDEKLHRLQDWDLWLRIGKKAPGLYVPQMLTIKRVHIKGITGSGPDTLLSADAYVRRKHHLPPLSWKRKLRVRLGYIKQSLLGEI